MFGKIAFGFKPIGKYSKNRSVFGKYSKNRSVWIRFGVSKNKLKNEFGVRFGLKFEKSCTLGDSTDMTERPNFFASHTGRFDVEV